MWVITMMHDAFVWLKLTMLLPQLNRYEEHSRKIEGEFQNYQDTHRHTLAEVRNLILFPFRALSLGGNHATLYWHPVAHTRLSLGTTHVYYKWLFLEMRHTNLRNLLRPPATLSRKKRSLIATLMSSDYNAKHMSFSFPWFCCAEFHLQCSSLLCDV